MLNLVYKTLPFAVLLALASWHTSPTVAQSTGAAPSDRYSADDSEEEARRRILESDQWRRTQRELNEWLSVQTLYSPDEVAGIRANLRDSVATKSARELEDFMHDMEHRLDVLMSPEAEDARLWLSQFMAVARNPEQQLGRARPDLLNMTAGQIRQELRWLQQTREQRLQSHATFHQSRASQSQMAQIAHDARQQAAPPVRSRADWPANNPPRRSPYAPQPELRPKPLTVYAVSPWGHPIFWHSDH